MKKVIIAFAAAATLAAAGLAATEASAKGGFGGKGHGKGGFGKGGFHHSHHGHHGHRWGYGGWRRGGVAYVGFAGGSCYRKIWTPYGWVVRNVCDIY